MSPLGVRTDVTVTLRKRGSLGACSSWPPKHTGQCYLKTRPLSQARAWFRRPCSQCSPVAAVLRVSVPEGERVTRSACQLPIHPASAEPRRLSRIHMVTHRHTDTYADTHRNTQRHTQAYTDTQSHTQARRQAHTHRHSGLVASSYGTVCGCPMSWLVLQPPSCRVSSPEAREPCPGPVSAQCRVAGGLQKSIALKDRRVAAWTPEWPNTWITSK